MNKWNRHIVALSAAGLLIASPMSFAALPKVATMASSKQKLQQQKTVTKLLTTLNHAKRKPLNSQRLASFASKDITISINGEQKARGLKQASKFLQHEIDVKHIGKISWNPDEVIVAGNNVVVHYYMPSAQVMANFTFNKLGKITDWSTVSA